MKTRVFNIDSEAVGDETKEVFVRLSPPSIEDNRSDLSRLTETVSAEHGIEITGAMPEVIRALPTFARSSGWRLTCVLAKLPEKEYKLIGLRGESA